MPQMKPMNWMLIYLSMNLILMIMNIKNYFMVDKIMKINFFKKMKKKLNNNWMW